eukprot:11760-Heterococcus_DN1.PRE.1
MRYTALCKLQLQLQRLRYTPVRTTTSICTTAATLLALLLQAVSSCTLYWQSHSVLTLDTSISPMRSNALQHAALTLRCLHCAHSPVASHCQQKAAAELRLSSASVEQRWASVYKVLSAHEL